MGKAVSVVCGAIMFLLLACPSIVFLKTFQIGTSWPMLGSSPKKNGE